MSIKPLRIEKDPLIQDTGSRILYRDCQGKDTMGYACGGQAGYLYTFQGLLSGRIHQVPLCARHAKDILGPAPTEPIEGVEYPAPDQFTNITLIKWMLKVKCGYAGNTFGVGRHILEHDPNTGASILVFVNVIGIEEGL